MKLAIDFNNLEGVAYPALNKPGGVTLGDIISSTFIYLFPIAGFILFIYLIAGGFQIMFSAGNPESVQKGQKKITNAVIGIIVVFTSFWIVQIVGQVLDLKGVRDVFGF